MIEFTIRNFESGLPGSDCCEIPNGSSHAYRTADGRLIED